MGRGTLFNWTRVPAIGASPVGLAPGSNLGLCACGEPPAIGASCWFGKQMLGTRREAVVSLLSCFGPCDWSYRALVPANAGLVYNNSPAALPRLRNSRHTQFITSISICSRTSPRFTHTNPQTRKPTSNKNEDHRRSRCLGCFFRWHGLCPESL